MGWVLTSYSFAGFVAAALSLLVATYAYRARTESRTRIFVPLMLALAGWSFAYAVQLGFTTEAEQLLWQRVGLAIGGTIPTLWLLFTLHYAGKEDWLTRRRAALLAIDPVAFTLLSLTNPWHGLVWGSATFSQGAGLQVLELSLGAGYYVHVAYSYLVVLAGVGLLLQVVFEASALYRKQTGALLLGVLPPFAANIAFTLRLDWGPWAALDLTPFAFAVTGVLLSLALYQFDLLERTPIARQQFINEMGDGLLVVDTNGLVIDLNPTARRIIEPTPAVGAPIGDFVDADGSTTESALAALDGQTLTTSVDGRRRAYDVDPSPLTDSTGHHVGDVIALRDVTERHRHEQKLEITHRVLRHNLRNDMTVIRGWAEELRASPGADATEVARRIVETADGLTDLVEKIRQLIALDEYGDSHASGLDVSRVVGDVVDDFRRSHPAATISWESPADVVIARPGEELLAIAVGNLVENALEHNDAQEPWVEVRVETAGDRIRIHVADDAPGIPAFERDVIESGVETPLDHGSGVGLWLVHWCVAELGGELSFSDRTPRGSVVTLDLPRAGPTSGAGSPPS